MMSKINIIGGEMALAARSYDFCLTDSGRSSLRLILKSLSPKLNYILPDFLCSSITNVFKELGLKYSFYRIKPDFSIDAKSLDGKKFDVFYSINYWGHINKIPGIVSREKILIDDNVFLPDFHGKQEFRNWAGFNSFRKISSAADGSLVKASFDLKKQLVSDGPALFSELKYHGKKIKHEFLETGIGSEKEYLTIQEEAEAMLDKQTRIYHVSERSVLEIMEFLKNITAEAEKRRKNFEMLASFLGSSVRPLKADFYSFCPLFLEKRDALRKYLFSKKIFLPVHWPKDNKNENIIYDKIISIPVEGRYGAADMKRMAKEIKLFYAKN